MRNVLRRIALDQELEVPQRVFETIIENSNGDMRAAVRDLQAVAEGNQSSARTTPSCWRAACRSRACTT